jgi:cell wall-associated NlpC family hydrolase
MIPRFAKLVPARSDLADLSLMGIIAADRYAPAVAYRIRADVAPIRVAPSPVAALDTQALRGEVVEVYDIADGWAWGRLAGDGYVGYLPANALGPMEPAPTHRVIVPRTLAFPSASIKVPPIGAPTLGACVCVIGQDQALAVLADGSHVPAGHLTPLDVAPAGDPVEVARAFLGVPYLWGGKTALGLDCSGLTQLAFGACGIALLRDSVMQAETAGDAVPFENPAAAARRGDLIFWTGHVGLMATDDRLIHANAFHMQVAEEPFTQAVARIAAAGSPVTAIRRIPL